MLDLEPIKGMLKDVKAGPWNDQVTADGGLVVYLDPPPPQDQPYSVEFLFFGDMEDTIWEDHATAAFIAHSRIFAPQMIEEIERLRALAAAAIDRVWYKQMGPCSGCGFGHKIDGTPFHSQYCPLDALAKAIGHEWKPIDPIR